MSADATTILTAVKGIISTLYPKVPVYTSKRRATDGRNMQNGFQSGFVAPCFVLSCSDAEEIDTAFPSFSFVTVGYSVVVEYVKPAQAAVANAPNAGAATVVEDADVRNVRATLRPALYLPRLTTAPTVYHVRYKNLGVYEAQSETDAVLVVSGMRFTYYAPESRPQP